MYEELAGKRYTILHLTINICSTLMYMYRLTLLQFDWQSGSQFHWQLLALLRSSGEEAPNPA